MKNPIYNKYYRYLLDLILTGLALCSIRPAAAGLPGSFYQLQTQGGGFVTGFAAHPNGRIFTRTDVGGLYRSDDHGTSWQSVSVDMASFAALCVQGVAVKPDNANVILQCVGTSDYSSDPLRGVWRSADGGSTWTHVLTGKNFSGNDQERFGGECIAFHPQNANEVWVGTRSQGVFRSMDGGSNWL